MNLNHIYIYTYVYLYIYLYSTYDIHRHTYLNSCSETPLKTHRKWWDLAVPPASGRHPAPGETPRVG